MKIEHLKQKIHLFFKILFFEQNLFRIFFNNLQAKYIFFENEFKSLELFII